MIIGIATTGAHWCRPTIALCKQQCRLKNRRDNSHKSRPDYRSAKIVQCKPSFRVCMNIKTLTMIILFCEKLAVLFVTKTFRLK